MKIIIAPQSFKGSLQAHEAARAMGDGVKAYDPDIRTVLLPIADGGSGTVRAMVEAAAGKLVTAEVHGPLGEKTTAGWGLLDGGKTAVIEMAAASGLSLLPDKDLDPLAASTYGTGELIEAALESGCRKIIVGLGDSATVDGGAGMACALGVRFLDEHGADLPPGGGGLEKLDRIDVSGRHPLLHGCEILCACDVTNTLYGTEGAATVYGPQKGATPEMVRRLDAALRRYAGIIIKDTGKDISHLPGGGAAGGLGAGMVAFLDAELKSGIELVCDSIGFDTHLGDADLVLVGEGRIDFQTVFGKTVAGIARRAKKADKPVIAIAGELGEGYQKVYECGIDAAITIMPEYMEKDEAMRQAKLLLENATEQAVRLFFSSSR